MILDPAKSIQAGPRKLFICVALAQDTDRTERQTSAQALDNTREARRNEIKIGSRFREEPHGKTMPPDIVGQ